MLTKDQLNREIVLKNNIERVVSLVPSQTEFLFDLGVVSKIVGITHYCIHPKSGIKNIQKIGGTKKLNIELIAQLKPDIIIANKEENLKGDIEKLSEFAPVWVSDISNLREAYEMMIAIGRILQKEIEAKKIVVDIQSNIEKLIPIKSPVNCAYFIWNNPLMTVGGDTFINSLLNFSGFTNVFHNYLRYPQITESMLLEANPEIIFLSSEPYPFQEKHIAYFNRIGFNKVYLVDGEMFSWYGSRLKYFPEYSQKLMENL